MHNSVKHCRSAQFETTEKGSCRRWKIDIITPTIGALDSLSCFDINVCRVGLCRRALHYVGMTQLVTEFTQTGGTCEIDTPHNSDIAWSDSFKIRKHQRTMKWLTKCLEATPINHHNGHLAAGNGSGNGADNSSNSDSDASDASDTENTDNVWVSGRLRSRTFKHRLMHRIRNTIDSQDFSPGTNITNKAIWLEGTATMRHIRLALEDNCSSCIRHPNLTIDGGSHSFTPAMQTNFDECCL